MPPWFIGGIAMMPVMAFLIEYWYESRRGTIIDVTLHNSTAHSLTGVVKAVSAVTTTRDRLRQLEACASRLWLIGAAYVACVLLAWYIAIPVVVVSALVYDFCLDLGEFLGRRIGHAVVMASLKARMYQAVRPWVED